MELNRENIIKALERCLTLEYGVACKGCPLSYKDERRIDCLEILMKNALSLIKELTAKITKWEKECDLRGDMWCKLNEENKKLTEENESLHASCTELERKCASLNDENERLRKHNIALEQKLMLLGCDEQYFFKPKVKGETTNEN